jgi:hypothetical protein
MNLTSSYTSFCIIHKYVNEILEKSNEQVVSFTNDPSNNLKELKRFFSIIESSKDIIFNRQEKSEILENILKTLRKSGCLGKRNEDTAMKVINENLGEDSCKILSGQGISKDMKGGIDGEIKIDNKSLTTQIKPYKTITETTSSFIIKGSSSTQTYDKVNLLTFVNSKSKQVRIFKTNDIQIMNNEYHIPKENEVLNLRGSNNIELIDCN